MIRLSIRRPVAVAMAYMCVALLGAFSWRNIPIENLPNVQLPRLTVRAQWPGASPETVEAFLTSPLESTIQQIRGVENIISTSYAESGAGVSTIEIEFKRDVDMDFARLDLSERLAQLEEELPEGVGTIQLQPYVPREFQNQGGLSDRILVYQITGPYTLEALRAHVDEVVKPSLEQINGVGQVVVSGGRQRLLSIELDEGQILALGLTPDVIRSSIMGLDLVREAGAIREGGREWPLTIADRAQNVDDILNAIVTTRGGRSVRVADLARVTETFEEARSLNRINGSPAVTFSVEKESRVNTVRVAEAVKERMAGLERLHPYGSRVIELSDASVRIKSQLTDLRYRALIAGAVIFVVLLLFLRSFRSAGMIFATIVFSVLISLNLIYFGGLTLNVLTLMGLAMGFGLIVDNSIVVLENVYRKWQGGEAPAAAAEKGAKEVVLPILAGTATTLIVFVPFVYLQGELRVFYVPLAIVVGLTLMASLFVAFTFIPSLAAKLLAAGGGTMGLSAAGHGAMGGAMGGGPMSGGAMGGGAMGDGVPVATRMPLYVRFYRALVGLTLRYPWVVVSVAVVCFGGSYYLFDKYVTRGTIFGGRFGAQETYVDVRITLPRGSDLARVDALTQFFEEKIAAMPEVDQYETNVNGESARIHITFPDSLELTMAPVAIKEQMVSYSLGFTGAQVRIYGVGPSFGYGGGGSAPNYRITVLGYNYLQVRDIAEDLGSRLQRMSRIQDVDTNASGSFTRDRASEFMVEVDRATLARYNMTVQELAGGLTAAIAGARPQQSTIQMGGDELQFEVKIEGAKMMDVYDLRETVITGPDGTGIRLGDVVSIYERQVLARIRRENQQYERTVAYEFRGPRRLGDLIRDQVLESTVVPEGYTVETSGGFRWSTEERNQIYMVLAISVLLIFMVTAALFESLLQPLCVLLTVPMALIGVFMIFFYVNANFSREAYIGVIMMGGIVVNNAILLVDHINRVRKRGGLSLNEAVLEGTLERVRPILMTTATTVLGLLPLVLASEAADANIWNALGYALIGGMLSSTFFVLTTTPALYLLFERGKVSRQESRSTAFPELQPAIGSD